jgi:hypothetical protein
MASYSGCKCPACGEWVYLLVVQEDGKKHCWDCDVKA